MNRAGTLGDVTHESRRKNAGVTGFCKHCGDETKNRVYCSQECRAANGDPTGKRKQPRGKEAERRAMLLEWHQQKKRDINDDEQFLQGCSILGVKWSDKWNGIINDTEVGGIAELLRAIFNAKPQKEDIAAIIGYVTDHPGCTLAKLLSECETPSWTTKHDVIRWIRSKAIRRLRISDAKPTRIWLRESSLEGSAYDK